jgi:peptide/nickel transport system permease protein
MLRYLGTRFVTAAITLLGVSLIVFFAMRIVPGGFVSAMLGAQAASQPELVAQIEEQYGLNDPLLVQYGIWLRNAVQGDFGESLGTRSSVSAEIQRRASVTIELTVLATLFSLLVGIPLGVLAAMKRTSATDVITRSFSLLGLSIPDFVLGTLLIYFVSTRHIGLPVSGYISFNEDIVGHFKSLLLPVLSLGMITTAAVMRVTRASVIETLNEPYVVTARAKGLHPRAVARRHVIRTALIPTVTIVGINMGYLLSGAVIIEEIFSLPGLGRYAFQGILNRDYPIAQGTILVGALLFVVTNLVVDLVYALLDPRIRY